MKKGFIRFFLSEGKMLKGLKSPRIFVYVFEGNIARRVLLNQLFSDCQSNPNPNPLFKMD